jgi:hypothetical protein
VTLTDPAKDKDGNDIRVPTLELKAGPHPAEQANNVLGHVNYIGMEAPTKGDEPKNTNRPVELELSVSTGSIRDAEDQLIWSGSYHIDQFEAFKKNVLGEEKWVFLVSDPHDIEVYHHDYKAPPPGKAGFVFGGGQAEGMYADFKDPDPAKTQETIDGQHALLRAVGDSIEAIGHFAAMLNNAAQLYALADENSCPPLNSTV